MRTRSLLLLPIVLVARSMSAQCSVDLAPDTVQVYYGYEPLSCIDLEAVGTGEGELAYAWSTGDTTSMVTACDTASVWYFVTLSDTTGCTVTDSVFVNAVDVHCGNNGNKVLLCHIPPGNPDNAHAICIGVPAVAAHLAHGCMLGACAPVEGDSLLVGGELQITVSPNPMSDRAIATVRSTIAQRVTLSGVDAMGRVVTIIHEGDMAAGEERALHLAGDAFPERTSMVWLRLQGASGTVVHQALIIGE